MINHYLLYFFTLGISAFAQAQEPLSMDEYLNQVRSENKAYQGSVQYRDGSKYRWAEGDLITSIKLTGLLQYKKDQALQATPTTVHYDSINTATYSLGLEKTTTFGLTAKISYDVNSFDLSNSNITQLGGTNPLTTAAPTVSLNQSLWQNGLGRMTQALIEVKQAQAETDRYSSQYELDITIQNAINAYWNLVLCKEIIAIRTLAVEQAESIYDYNLKRSHMNLGEQADAYTAKASVESRRLDLQVAVDAEDTARRQFNQYRNVSPMTDPGILNAIDWNYIATYKLPEHHFGRSDVLAAKFQAQVNSANSRIQEEKDLPALNAYGSYALNGQATDLATSISNSYSANRPTAVIGVNLSMPLDFNSVNKARLGARAQSQAAETIFQQKLLDQEADWADIQQKVVATQRRVLLAGTIEEAQKTKLEFEKTRLKNGRTSTYQILLYEQDYTSARLAKVQSASDMISLLSRARLYKQKEGAAE